MYQKLIPDNTPINSYFLSGTAGYILYSEVGPFYDEDVNDSLYVVNMLMFTLNLKITYPHLKYINHSQKD